MRTEEVKPYDEGREKGEQVGEMFDSIAPAYDFMNSAMTFGMHRLWRRKALRMLNESLRAGPKEVLDIACGTGDVTFHLARLFPEARVTGADLSTGMLRVARRKLAERHAGLADRIRFMEADCMALPMADNSFGAVTVAYGVRNFQDLEGGYREMLRVLRPGGTLCVIELCEPKNAPMRFGYKLYTRTLIPLAGRFLSGDRSAYTYLPRSISACPQRGDMTSLMLRAGFCEARYKVLFPSTVGVYLARKGIERIETGV